jgi:hypothetical protein
MLSTDVEVTCSEGSLALAISSSTKSKSEIVVSVSVVTATVGLARGAFSPGRRVSIPARDAGVATLGSAVVLVVICSFSLKLLKKLLGLLPRLPF